jgi:tetratricopeptide (TPR) repeat protein
VTRDPGETQNLLAGRDPAPWRQAIAALAELPALESATASDPALLEELRGLGYAAVAPAPSAELPHPLAPNDLPPPSVTAAEHDAFLHAMDLTHLGQAREAEESLRALLATNPHNRFARELLGFNLQKLGRTAEAAAEFEELVRSDGPAWPHAWLNLGLCYRALGRTDEALRALEHAAQQAPRDAQSLRALVETLRAAGRDAAEAEARLAELQR